MDAKILMDLDYEKVILVATEICYKAYTSFSHSPSA